ncbi:glycosyltransferase family 2 protein [Neptuniibacter sp.]|uniref:glycosyltransferase family 2 protein n=1 Tax=Neptuniibacter sp. TaxID=1962643 RepID=UPI00260DB76F|nr:glycosyltransferase family 2 protein [Neptuniibacter sp.]MCP4595152.1 glycosyltransferase family 2 protein [Neptuniibacter sp.]
MKVSVVIPSYNRWPKVKDAIDSVLAQELEPGDQLQCVVVDDGSTDETEASINQLYKDQVLYLKNSPNKEKSFSRNRGAQEADGELICCLDSDDELTPGSLKARMEPFKAGFQGVVFTATQRPGKTPEEALTQFQTICGAPYGVASYLEAPSRISNNCYMLYRSEFVRLQGYNADLTNMEDMQLFIRLICEMEVLLVPFVSNRVHASAVSARSAYGKIIQQFPKFSESLVSLPQLNASEKNTIGKLDCEECLAAYYHVKNYKGFAQTYQQIASKHHEWLPTNFRFKKRYLIARLRSLFS